MRRVRIGGLEVTGLCLGGNPFSGYSHQGPAKNREMLAYYTPGRIRQTLREAEEAGINTFFGRTDEHIFRIIREYRAEGGAIQWFAQVDEEHGDYPTAWRKWLAGAVKAGAAGAYLHGGFVDYWHAHAMYDSFREMLKAMRDAGLAAGFAGHTPQAHRWISENLDVDFQMCSHYNPTDRADSPRHIPDSEKWRDSDREAMARVIARINKPVVHYKVFAGGNRPVEPAFRYLGGLMRPQDAAVIGIYTRDDPGMIRADIALFEKHAAALAAPPGESASRG